MGVMDTEASDKVTHLNWVIQLNIYYIYLKQKHQVMINSQRVWNKSIDEMFVPINLVVKWSWKLDGRFVIVMFFFFSILQKLKYPISVFFIIVNEFCERFSYYGMRSK